MTGWTRAVRQSAMLVLAMAIGEVRAPAAPPPPGWAEAYRARVCGTPGPTTEVDMHVRTVAPREAGVRLARRAPIAVAWAVDLDLPKYLKPIAITFASHQGTLLLASNGSWVRIAGPDAPIVEGKVETHAIGDGTRPKAASSESDGTVATIQQDDSTISRYDLGTCGYGAKAQPAFRLSPGARAGVIAEISPNLGGFAENPYILVGGSKNGRPGQLGFWPVDGGNVDRPFGEPFARGSDDETLVVLAGFDIASGCDGVAGFRDARGRTTLRTFCKPGHSDRPIMLLGDVGVSGVRSPNAVRQSVPLAIFSVPVLGAVQAPSLKDGRLQLLVLAKASGGATRIIALSGTPASYKIQS